MIRVIVDPARPDPKAIEQVASRLRAGEVAAVPTDTLYGLAADPFNPRAVARIFSIKGRSGERALPLIAADTAQVARWVGELPMLGARLALRFWPGPLTLILSAPRSLAAVTGGKDTVGVRVPAHVVARALCAATGRPLTATSANISGERPTDDPADVAARLEPSLDVLLDAGRTPGGPASTIVDVTGTVPGLIRAGAIPWDRVQACAREE